MLLFFSKASLHLMVIDSSASKNSEYKALKIEESSFLDWIEFRKNVSK
jgi:hypothetical protein